MLLGAQPGAGKSRAMNEVCESYPGRHFADIVGDDLRLFHPDYQRFLDTDPAHMPDITAQAYGAWVQMTTEFPTVCELLDARTTRYSLTPVVAAITRLTRTPFEQSCGHNCGLPESDFCPPLGVDRSGDQGQARCGEDSPSTPDGGGGSGTEETRNQREDDVEPAMRRHRRRGRRAHRCGRHRSGRCSDRCSWRSGGKLELASSASARPPATRRARSTSTPTSTAAPAAGISKRDRSRGAHSCPQRHSEGSAPPAQPCCSSASSRSSSAP